MTKALNELRRQKDIVFSGRSFTLLAGPVEGSSSRVFKAIEKQSHKIVALKFPVGDDLRKWSIASQQIENECIVLERLEQFTETIPITDPRKTIINELLCHPILSGNVSLPQPYGESKYLIMDWAKGTTLDKILRSGKGEMLSLGSLVRILTDLAQLFSVAHSLGFINNDIDAKHVFWSKEHDTLQPDRVHGKSKIIDWANAVFFDGRNPVLEHKDIVMFGELIAHLLFESQDSQSLSTISRDSKNRDEPDEAHARARLNQIANEAMEPTGIYSKIDVLYDHLKELSKDLQLSF